MDPIFIIGTERSGTNLLRLILNTHPDIAVPHPPHIMKLFTPLLHLYGDLTDDRLFKRLIADVCRMVELHTYPWEITPNREQVFLEAAGRELICIYFALYDQYLQQSGKKRWCCKSTFMIDHVADILRFYPEARFIFMVRDGRDVAVSAKSSIFNHYHPFYSAKRWRREQRLGLDWLQTLPREQIILLKYEELTEHPQETVARLCTFLSLPFHTSMLEFHRSHEASKSASLSISWQNTSKPVLSGNRGKFRNQLTGNEILMYEAIACIELEQLGYGLVNQSEQLLHAAKDLARERFTYRVKEWAMKLRTETDHLLKDRNSGARIRKNLFMTYLAVTRKFSTDRHR